MPEIEGGRYPRGAPHENERGDRNDAPAPVSEHFHFLMIDMGSGAILAKFTCVWTFDAQNPNRLQALEIHTTHRDDGIKEIVAKRVRD